MWKKILHKKQSIKTQNLAPYLRVEKTVKQEDKEPLKKKKKSLKVSFQGANILGQTKRSDREKRTCNELKMAKM